MIDPYRFASGGGGSPPTYVASSVATSSRNIAVPTGTLSGDFMVAFVGAFNPSTITTPTGWTLLTQTTWQSGSYSSGFLYRVASGSEPATYAFTNGTNYNYGYIATYRGASQIDVSGTITEVSGTSMTFTGITSSANSLLLACLHDRDDISLTQPSGMTSRINSQSGFLWRAGLADLANASNANRTWTVSSSSTNGCGLLVSIKA